MAAIDLQGVTLNATVRPQTGTAVFVKREWEDDWTWLPYIVVDMAEESASPVVPRASFHYRYGRTSYADNPGFQNYKPYYINGAYVKIVVYDWWGSANLWFGEIDVESVHIEGETAFAQGTQAFSAFGLEQILRRRFFEGTYTENGRIGRSVRFNRSRTRGINESDNRSSGKGADGAFVFSGDGFSWNNKNIAEYGLIKYANVGGPNFVLSGQTTALTSLIDEYQFEGRSVYDVLNELINRRNGLGWRILTNGEGDVHIYVFSASPIPISTGGIFLPANRDQVAVTFVGSRNVDATITFNKLSEYDEIKVIGGSIFSCFTVSYEDDTFIQGWELSQETEYRDAVGNDDADEDDLFRKQDKYARVYQAHKIPEDWDGIAGDGEGGEGGNALPVSNNDGQVIVTTQGNVWGYGLSLERELPFDIEPTENDNEVEKQKPFVLCQIDETDPGAPDGTYWALVDGLKAVELDGSNVSVGDTWLTLHVEPSINHINALGNFDPDIETSNTDPQVDHRTFLATVNLETDQRIRVITSTPGRQSSEVARKKVIRMPDAVAWYVVPNTVTGIDEGVLTRHAGGLVRDDSPRVRAMAAFALAWYGIKKSTVSFEMQTVDLSIPVGAMIIGAFGPAGFSQIATPVTRRVWRFGEQQGTTYETGYVELTFKTRRKASPKSQQRAGRRSAARAARAEASTRASSTTSARRQPGDSGTRTDRALAKQGGSDARLKRASKAAKGGGGSDARLKRASKAAKGGGGSDARLKRASKAAKGGGGSDARLKRASKAAKGGGGSDARLKRASKAAKGGGGSDARLKRAKSKIPKDKKR